MPDSHSSWSFQPIVLHQGAKRGPTIEVAGVHLAATRDLEVRWETGRHAVISFEMITDNLQICDCEDPDVEIR